jgi:ABC-type sugar transport system ATPase subunit
MSGNGAGKSTLIMDEPTSSLTAAEAEKQFGIIRQLEADGS